MPGVENWLTTIHLYTVVALLQCNSHAGAQYLPDLLLSNEHRLQMKWNPTHQQQQLSFNNKRRALISADCRRSFPFALVQLTSSRRELFNCRIARAWKPWRRRQICQQRVCICYTIAADFFSIRTSRQHPSLERAASKRERERLEKYKLV